MPAPISLFSQHSRRWQGNRYVYPVISRRSLGLSVGVNLNPDKVCNYNCVYCSVDRTVPGAPPEVDLAALAAELDQMLELVASGELFLQAPFDRTAPALRRFNDIALSGDGEPTSSPAFPAACQLARSALERHAFRQTKVVVITNGTCLDAPAVQGALAQLGERGEVWAKLDAGTEDLHRRLNRSKIPLARILENLSQAGKARPLVVQSMFLKLRDAAPSPAEIDAYLEQLQRLRSQGCQISRIQAYTVARSAAEAFVAPLERAELDAIVARIRALGFAVDPFYAP